MSHDESSLIYQSPDALPASEKWASRLLYVAGLMGLPIIFQFFGYDIALTLFTPLGSPHCKVALRINDYATRFSSSSLYAGDEKSTYLFYMSFCLFTVFASAYGISRHKKWALFLCTSVGFCFGGFMLAAHTYLLAGNALQFLRYYSSHAFWFEFGFFQSIWMMITGLLLLICGVLGLKIEWLYYKQRKKS